MLDKNGLPLQFPPSAFSAFPGLHPGLDPRTSPWSSHPALQSAAAAAAAAAAHNQPGMPPTSSAAMFQSEGAAAVAAGAALLGLPHPHPALSPTYFNAHSPSASMRGVTHQDYLNAAAQRLGELQASAALDPLNALEASSLRASLNRANRKRALSASPYSEVDLNTLIRYSPTALHLLNVGVSPSSSGSYSHLSAGAISPALVHSAHLQQLQAHLIRSASSSPFLSPQNSLQASLFHSSAAAAAAAALHTPTTSYFPIMGSNSVKVEAKDSQHPEPCSNVVSSTMEDEDSREAPLVTVKTEPCHQVPQGHHKNRSSDTSQVKSAVLTETGADIKDEPDFVETHCSWVGCDRDLYTQDQLVKHLNNDHIGNSKKAFVCQWKECSREEKPFKAQYMLVVHMRRHTGEKPHRCTFENCAKAYSRLENLKTHLRSHTGEKPYTCEFPGCSKAFSNASDRAKHQNRTHSNEKPYACKAPGCTKRYTDPSSLRKHVKTVHGHEFYANKRHKGNQYDKGSSGDDSSGVQPTTPRTPHSVSTNKSEVDNSPAPISPQEDRHSGNGAVASGPLSMANNSMPLSDNNVSTTHNSDPMTMANWDLHETEDINMAVAAAIGVGSEEPVPMPATNGLSQRLSNKMKMMPPQQQPSNGPAVLGDINRSIEKMSITQTYNNGTTQRCSMQQTISAANMGTNARRDSNWTNSTEGYGSMRSEQSMMSSRRCSDVSAMSQNSNVSTRALMNSPWDPISADSSRRSSMTGHHDGGSSSTGGGGIGQHLTRLHRKAQHHHHMQAATPTATPTPSMVEMSGRQSAMSECTVTATPTNGIPPHHMEHHGGARRASDPVRTLDRNFGLDGQLSRHQRSGSYTQISMDQQQRVPMHGQRIRGMSGDTFFHPQQQQPLQQQQQAMPQGPPMYNNAARMAGNVTGFNTSGQYQYNQQQLAGPNNYQQQQSHQQGMWPGNMSSRGFPSAAGAAGQYQQYTTPDANGGQSRPAPTTFNSPAAVGQFNANQQWASQQNWSGWQQQQQVSAHPTVQQQPLQQQQQQQQPKSNDSYQRTFDYVQQCQNWTSQ